MEEIREVTLHGVSIDGRSVGRTDSGLTVFVRGGIPGQKVQIRLEKRKKNMAEGVVVSVLQHALEERKPLCPHSDMCGGCPWQSIPYTVQLRYKRQIVIDCLKRIGKLTFPEELISPVLSTGSEWHYRNKMEFAFGREGKEIVLGLRQRGTHTVFNINQCLLQSCSTENILGTIRNECRQAGLLPAFETANGIAYSLRGKRGAESEGKKKPAILKYAVIRQPRNGGCFLELITKKSPSHYDLIRKMGENVLRKNPELSGFIHTVQTKNINAAYGDKTVTRLEKTDFFEKLQIHGRSIELKLGYDSFFQVNTDAAELLYNTAVNLSLRYFLPGEGSGNNTDKKIGCVCWDIYGGVGGLALSFAPYFDEIFGLEAVSGAAALAEINAEAYSVQENIKNFSHPSFSFAADTASRISAYFQKKGVPDLLIADPPRAGLEEKMTEALLEYKPQRITMISCNPAALARDLGRLAEKYEILNVCPVDIFPQTQHIETISILLLKSEIKL